MENLIANALEKEIIKENKFHAVLLFYTEIELGISNIPGKWVCTNVKKFNNGTQALHYYANTPNPASQLVSAETEEELDKEIEIMKNNYQNKQWLDECLYPYL